MDIAVDSKNVYWTSYAAGTDVHGLHREGRCTGRWNHARRRFLRRSRRSRAHSTTIAIEPLQSLVTPFNVKRYLTCTIDPGFRPPSGAVV